MRALEDIERDIELINEELKPIDKVRNELCEKRRFLLDEKERYILDNGLFHPISELVNYIGKEISHIDLVERNEDGSLEVDSMYNDEMFSIDKNGYLEYSSYFGGVMDFDEKIGKYVLNRFYHRTEHDYIGYLDLKLKDDD